jgi:hypothetical protein
VVQRIALVSRLITSGLTRAAVMQAVAETQAKEAEKRVKLRLAAFSEAEIVATHPLVWGDEPPAERTVDRYISKAKALIAEEGKELTRQREYVLGVQLARASEMFAYAMRQGKIHAAARVWEGINRMFGLEEAIKVLLLGTGKGGAVRVQHDGSTEPVHDLSSPAARARALATILANAGDRDPQLRPVLQRILGRGTDPASNN